MDAIASSFSRLKADTVDRLTQLHTKGLKPHAATVFGAAPSLQAMRDLNLLTKDKKTLFRGVEFWYFFRLYYFKLLPVIFLILMIIALTAWNSVTGHLILGSILSLISSSAVISSYVMIIPWRKHPSSLVVYRALTSFFFALNIIANAISEGQSCFHFSVTTNALLLAGEAWLTTIALDLVYSLTNPFVSYRGNLRKYHIMVWLFTSFITFTFAVNKPCMANFDQGICWIKADSAGAPCLWGYYLFWVLCMYAYQLYASIFAYNRLRKGLPSTFEIRKKCAEETYKCLMTYAIYMSILMFFFAIFSSNSTAAKGTSMNNFGLFLLYVIANRGSVDGLVWFMLHDFAKDETVPEDGDGDAADVSGTALEGGEREREREREKSDSVKYKKLKRDSRSTNVDADADPEADAASDDSDYDSRAMNLMDPEQLKENLGKTLTELADLAIAEYDEGDMSPQVNMALRKQVVEYVTTGVRDAILKSKMEDLSSSTLTSNKRRNSEAVHMGAKSGGFVGSMVRTATSVISDSAQPRTGGKLPVTEFLLDGEHPFAAFAPDLFQELRMGEGIDDEGYLNTLRSTANERLSEGASGAFMFFCGGGEFIVKTIRVGEARVLHTALQTYYEYVKREKESFLCRFLGSYSLGMYATTFYFVVMKNCFEPSVFINERYDIKGSWVGRSADPVKPAKKVICRNCNEMFVPMKKEMCSAIVGPHEASVVLKDNDLRIKISLESSAAKRVVEQLKRDSDLMAQIGVMDYSLLIGVKKFRFGVDVDDSDIGVDSSKSASTYKASAVSGPGVYYFGVVDFLQDWTLRKRIERAIKIYIFRKDPEGLSVMHPDPYKDRFQVKMEQIFDMENSSASIGSEASHVAKVIHSSQGSPDRTSKAGKTPSKAAAVTDRVDHGTTDNDWDVVNVLHTQSASSSSSSTSSTSASSQQPKNKSVPQQQQLAPSSSSLTLSTTSAPKSVSSSSASADGRQEPISQRPASSNPNPSRGLPPAPFLSPIHGAVSAQGYNVANNEIDDEEEDVFGI